LNPITPLNRLPDKNFFRNYQLDPDLLLDFNSVGIERVIPLVEVRNKHLLNLYNNRGRVYKPVLSPIVAKIDTQHANTTPNIKRRKGSIETVKSQKEKRQVQISTF